MWGMDSDDIGREVNNWEKNRWRRDKESKTTLELQRSNRNMEDEVIYSNEHGSFLLFPCRTNTLKLRWRPGFEGGAVDCLLRGGEEETVRHFIKECGELHEIRRRYAYMEPNHYRMCWCLWRKVMKMSTYARRCSKRYGGWGGGALSGCSDVRWWWKHKK